MDKRQSIVVLGAGYAGVAAVKRLCQKIKPYKSDYRIVLVDRRPYHTLLTDLHEVAGGRIEPESVLVDLRKLFGHLDVEIVTDEITHIDYGLRRVSLRGGEVLDYRYLLMGLGSQTSYFDIPGAKDHSLTLWSYEEAVKIREHIKSQFTLAIGEKNPQLRSQRLTFTIAGGGYTGVEIAGELAEWLPFLCSYYQIPRPEVRVLLVEGKDQLCSTLKEKLSIKIHRRLVKMGVEVVLNAPITEANQGNITLNHKEKIQTNTLIWTAGVECNPFVVASGITTAHHQRARVNDFLESVDHSDVYLMGDNAYLEIDGQPILQVVETALQSANQAVDNVVHRIKGENQTAFRPNYHGFMVSVGSRYAVADVVVIQLSWIFAMAVKHLINVHYLFKIGGIAVAWHYLYGEFFGVSQNRSILGGHVSRVSHVFFLLPLRIYLGIMWLLQGLEKVEAGWLKPENNFLTRVDGVGGATEVWEEGGQAVAQLPPIFESPLGIYEWFAETFIARAPFFFQVSVVVVEIAVGLALIAGLFTVLASLGSVFLGVTFAIAGMADWGVLWYIIAPVAFLGGGGRAFGLDYYLSPVLKRLWKRLGFVRKWHIYID